MSRANTRTSSQHVILGTQQLRPTELANAITLNLDNAWGVLRVIIEFFMKQPPGKYIMLKDPQQVELFIRYFFRIIFLAITRVFKFLWNVIQFFHIKYFIFQDFLHFILSKFMIKHFFIIFSQNSFHFLFRRLCVFIHCPKVHSIRPMKNRANLRKVKKPIKLRRKRRDRRCFGKKPNLTWNWNSFC